MNGTGQQLRDLLPPEQIQQLEAVRRKLLEDPNALSTKGHDKEEQDEQAQA